MALTPEDVQAIGQLLDQRMAQHSEAIAKQLRDQERRRRRFWSWVIWITIALTVASSVWSYYWLKDKMAGLLSSTALLERDLQQSRTELVETRSEYAREYAHDQAMQKERAEAAAASGYKSGQSQAQFDAGLLAKTFALVNRTNEARAHAQQQAKSGATEPDDESLKDLDQTISQASGLLMQLMLHETDPEHQGSAEKITSGEQGSATPIQQAPESHVIAPGSPRSPAASQAPLAPAQKPTQTPPASGATTTNTSR